MENQKKRRLFYQGEAKRDAVAEDTTPTLGYFFKLLWRKLGKILSLNLLVVLRFLPLVACVIIFLSGPRTQIPSCPSSLTSASSDNCAPLYAPLLGAYAAGSPTAGTLLSAVGYTLGYPVLTTGRLVAIIILIALTVLTWGWQTVGATYNYRSFVRGDSCFILSDYIYAIKKNLWQAFFFGILDCVILFFLGFDIYYFYALSEINSYGFLYVLILIITAIYLLMRFYIYPMMITFDLKTRKLLKNGLIFSLLGFKRNLVAMLGILLLLFANLYGILWGLSVGLSVLLILPFFYLATLLGFIGTYAAYPNIQRYMIDPYLNGENSEAAEESDTAEDEE